MSDQYHIVRRHGLFFRSFKSFLFLFFLVSSLFFGSFFAQAKDEQQGFSGVWRGQFIYTTIEGKTLGCNELKIEINQQKRKALFGTFSYICGDLAIHFVPPTLSLKNGEVFHGKAPVGEYTDKTADLLFVINDVGGRVHYELKITPNKALRYRESHYSINEETGKEEVRIIDSALLREI